MANLRIFNRRFGAWFLVAGIAVFFPLQSSAQDMASAATFGGALLIGLNKAGDLIRQAREAGNDLLLGTGVEIQNAITSAQIAYESSLNKTMKDVTDVERKFVTDMDNVFKNKHRSRGESRARPSTEYANHR
jgi:hypothetical protein